jgi:long-chain fatty acid transport protein
MKKRIFLLSALVALTISGNVYATGFQLLSESVFVRTTAGAGAASEADDASTAYYNSAGMTRLKQPQASLSILGIYSRTTFRGTATVFPTITNPIVTPFAASGTAHTRTVGGVPGIFMVNPVSDTAAVGLSITFPYGLAADYSKQSIIRYVLSQEIAAVVDVAPSVAFRLCNLSIGFGPNFEYFYENSETMVRTQPLTFTDSRLESTFRDIGAGWHLGGLWEITPATRVGVNYRSAIHHHGTGKSSFFLSPSILGPAFEFKSNALTADLTLPSTTSFSIYHDMTCRWAVMAEGDYTRWDVFDTVNIKGLASPTGIVDRTVQEKFSNGWYFALGTSYQYTPKLKLRGGISTNENVTNEQFRNSTIPVVQDLTVEFGGRYQVTPQLSIDATYGHNFMRNARINYVDSVNGITQMGSSKTTTDVAGIQLNWTFV